MSLMFGQDDSKPKITLDMIAEMEKMGLKVEIVGKNCDFCRVALPVSHESVQCAVCPTIFDACSECDAKRKSNKGIDETVCFKHTKGAVYDREKEMAAVRKDLQARFDNTPQKIVLLYNSLDQRSNSARRGTLRLPTDEDVLCDSDGDGESTSDEDDEDCPQFDIRDQLLDSVDEWLGENSALRRIIEKPKTTVMVKKTKYFYIITISHFTKLK